MFFLFLVEQYTFTFCNFVILFICQEPDCWAVCLLSKTFWKPFVPFGELESFYIFILHVFSPLNSKVSLNTSSVGFPWYFSYIYITRVEWCNKGSVENYQVKYFWRVCFTFLVWNRLEATFKSLCLFIMAYFCLNKLPAKINCWNTDALILYSLNCT